MALEGGTVAIGGWCDDGLTADRGAAYLFALGPTLRLDRSAPGLAALSWTPTNSPGFVLQYTESLAPGNWLPAPSGATNPVTAPTTGAGRFYRAAQP